MRAGVWVEFDAVRAQVGLALLALEADVAQQAREHGQVYRLVAGGLGVDLPAVFLDHGEQLRMDVAPLAHAADVDEVLAQQAFPLAVAELVAGRFVWVIGLNSFQRPPRLRGQLLIR